MIIPEAGRLLVAEPAESQLLEHMKSRATKPNEIIRTFFALPFCPAVSTFVEDLSCRRITGGAFTSPNTGRGFLFLCRSFHPEYEFLERPFAVRDVLRTADAAQKSNRAFYSNVKSGVRRALSVFEEAGIVRKEGQRYVLLSRFFEYPPIWIPSAVLALSPLAQTIFLKLALPWEGKRRTRSTKRIGKSGTAAGQPEWTGSRDQFFDFLRIPSAQRRAASKERNVMEALAELENGGLIICQGGGDLKIAPTQTFWTLPHRLAAVGYPHAGFPLTLLDTGQFDFRYDDIYERPPSLEEVKRVVSAFPGRMLNQNIANKMGLNHRGFVDRVLRGQERISPRFCEAIYDVIHIRKSGAMSKPDLGAYPPEIRGALTRIFIFGLLNSWRENEA